MSYPICVVCDKRPTPDGYACTWCANRTEGKLADIADLTPDARLVAAGLVRRGRGSGSNKPGSRSPLNDGATDAMDEIQNLLTTLARDIAEREDRALPAALRVLSHALRQHGRAIVNPTPDPIIIAARFLATQTEWLRHSLDGTEPYAVRAFDEIATCAGRLRGIVNGPGEQKYLGPCGAPIDTDRIGNLPIVRDVGTCAGDVYAYRGAKVGRCKTCGAEVATSEREAWLDGEVREHAFRAAHIADAYGISADTIRSWALRGQLRSYWRTVGGIIADWTDPPEGEKRDRLHYVGDVLTLAAADAARRATEQAKRARRRERAALDDDGRLSA